MSDQDKIAAIRRIKKTHENFVVFGGISIGVILGIYFFTFSGFIDKAPSLAYFQAVTAILWVLALIYIRRVAFFLTRLLLGRNPQCKTLMSGFDVADLGEDEQALLEIALKRLGNV